MLLRYQDIHDRMILNYEFLKISIFEETKILFEDRPYILDKWKQEAYRMTEEEVKKSGSGLYNGTKLSGLIFLIHSNVIL